MDASGGISTVVPRPPTPLAWLKPGVFAGAMIPLLVFAQRYWTDQFNDPIAEILNKLGLLALVFLLASLACTPLKLITGWTWPAAAAEIAGPARVVLRVAPFSRWRIWCSIRVSSSGSGPASPSSGAPWWKM